MLDSMLEVSMFLETRLVKFLMIDVINLFVLSVCYMFRSYSNNYFP